MGEYISPGERAHMEMMATQDRMKQVREAKTPAQMLEVAQTLYGADLKGTESEKMAAVNTLLSKSDTRAQGAELSNLYRSYVEAKNKEGQQEPSEQQFQQAA